jgi:uncharacterized NAD(P)/FAD-binding protein YdhS
VGTLTRGARWEVTAIPELREQANTIVRRVLHDHAVERVSEIASPTRWPAPVLQALA